MLRIQLDVIVFSAEGRKKYQGLAQIKFWSDDGNSKFYSA